MIRVGIIFGGRSREREISFAGGRTVYDNLDKALFEPVPIFVDSLGNFCLLDWQYIYKGTIRDFYPGPSVNDGEKPWQIYADSLGNRDEDFLHKLLSGVGKPVSFSELPKLIDFAFLTLHGPYGEDGGIQGILEWLGLPYSGCGIYPSAFGINKIRQRKQLAGQGFPGPANMVINRAEFLAMAKSQNTDLIQKVQSVTGFPCVIKAPHQGSSVGISVLKDSNPDSFHQALCRSFFLEKIESTWWKNLGPEARVQWMNSLLDVRSGIGLPVSVYSDSPENPTARCYMPEDLLMLLDKEGWQTLWLEPDDAEDEILVEAFIEGKEFSCIVVEKENGEPLALPPTEIIKSSDMFDYRAKYLPGISRKITPIDIPAAHLETIRQECERLYKSFGFQVYARLDGFISNAGTVVLNDPNTTSGMLPSSFFFHQAAEIGLNPSQFLSFIIFRSIQARQKNGKERYKSAALLEKMEQLLSQKAAGGTKRKRVGIIMGGYSTERHISLESGRNIYEKLSSSTEYLPIPVFLTGNDADWKLYRIPVKMMLKDNADDVKHLVENPAPKHAFISRVIQDAADITRKFASDAVFDSEPIPFIELGKRFDSIFIALHGRPGEDGSIQKKLDEISLPYNGSGAESSSLTINKFETNALLRKHNISVARHRMVFKTDWESRQDLLWDEIEAEFLYPFIAKPADDGCSSAVKKIKTRDQLVAFSALMFRQEEEKPAGPASVLGLRPSEEFPQKNAYLIESLIGAEGAEHFLEITGGMRTSISSTGERVYEVFEPSETLASGEVLSLEEKFLAGEGQNITPARFSKNQENQNRISSEVRKTLEKTARILNVEGYCRIDAFVRIFSDGRVETIIIEINSLPGMTPATCIFHQAAIDKLKPVEFIDSILKYGSSRQHKKELSS
jgi:D-alanine-D-alanine ligase